MTGGAAAIPMAMLVGAVVGGTAGVAGQLVQDLATGQKPRLENYILPAAVGALGGAAAGVIMLGGAALGLPTVAAGAAVGFSVGAISQYATNVLPKLAPNTFRSPYGDRPWYASVAQMALVGGIGGAVGGAIAAKLLSSNAGVGARMLAEGLSDALVSAGTQAGLNVIEGAPLGHGVGLAFAAGMTTGAVGGAVGRFAEGWMQRQMALSRLRSLDDFIGSRPDRLRSGLGVEDYRARLTSFDDGGSGLRGRLDKAQFDKAYRILGETIGGAKLLRQVEALENYVKTLKARQLSHEFERSMSVDKRIGEYEGETKHTIFLNPDFRDLPAELATSIRFDRYPDNRTNRNVIGTTSHFGGENTAF
jgi:hypothetical protein